MNEALSDTISLRQAVRGDAVAISALISSLSHFFTIEPDGSGAEQFLASVSVDAVAGYVAASNMRYLMAEEGSTLVGVVAIRDNSHLYHLFIAPAYQGRGLARKMWLNVRAKALASGNPGRFTVNASQNAIEVYRQFGFAPAGELTEMHGIRFLPMQLETH